MSSADNEDVIGNVVRTFEADGSTEATQGLLRSMQSTTVTSIIGSIRNPPPHITPNRLLRALWSVPAIRPTILTSLAEAMASSFTDVDASLLEEIDFLLVAHARNPSRPHERRLKDISLCASYIAKQSKEVFSPVHGPMLVYCARAASVINTTQGQEVRTKILQFLLLSMCDDENIAVQAVIALLENELDIAEEEERVMMNIILRFVSTNCLEGDLPDVLRAILFSLTKTNSSHKAYVLSWLVFVIIQRATGDVLTEIVNVVDVMVLDSEVVCDRIANAFWSVLNYSSREEHSAQKRFRFSPSHVAVLYCILSDASTEAQQEYLYYILERMLLDPAVSFDISTAASSSSSAGDEDFRRKAIFVESIKILAVQNRSQTILEFYEGLLWKSKKYQEWGSMMLLELFVWVSESRRSILNIIFGTIVQTETADYTVNAFCALYERIAGTPRSAFALRECQDGLKEALELISLLPSSYDCRILKASVPIFVTCPNLTDSMIMYLRKAAGSRSRKFQIIACTGLLTALEQDYISKETTQTCSETLKLMMETTDITVKSHLITKVLKFIRRKPEYTGRIADLSELLMKQFVIVLQNPGVRPKGDECTGQVANRSEQVLDVSLSITNCFGQVYGEYILREPVALLAKFCMSIAFEEERMMKHMEQYMKYLGNENGALMDACLVSTSKAPVLARVKTLCEQYDVLFGTGYSNVGANHCLAYGLGLMVRDHLDGRSQSGKNSDESSKQSSSEQPQFASMTAREAASKLHSSSIQPTFNESVTFKERLDALKVVEGIPEEEEIAGVLKKKICSEVLGRLRHDLKAGLLDDGDRIPTANQMKAMVSTLCSMYHANCPWLLKRNSAAHQESTSTEQKSAGDEPSNSRSAGREHHSQNCVPSSLYRRVSSHAHLANDVRRAIEVRQLQLLDPSLRIAIRHSVLSILITLCSFGCLEDELETFAQLLQPAAEGVGETAKDTEREEAVLSQRSADPQKGETFAAITKVIHLVLRTIRLEFANSMSVGLTLTYMELVSVVIQAVRSRGKACLKSIGALVFTAMTDILREYSVRHVTVLREMLRLCLRCMERSAALEFGRRLLLWLGNSSSLLNSRFSVEDIDDKRLKVMEFDPDIVAEGMALDAEVEDEEDGEERDEATMKASSSLNVQSASEVETHAAEKRPSKSVDGTQSDTTVNDAHRSTQESGSSASEDKSIKSLCLDETADVGLISIVTVLAYCQEIVTHDVHGHRFMVREDRDSVSVPTTGKEDCSVQIASILRDFCNTSFAKLVSPKQRAWPDVLVKKIDFILHGLLDCAELKLRLAVKAARRESGAGRCTPVFRAALSILRSLYDESTTKSSVFATAKAMSRLNKVSLEERLRTTSMEVSQVVRENSEAFDKNVAKEWNVMLKNLSKGSSSSISRALGTLGKEASAGVSDHVRVSHPRKRQRLRSRNSGIDDWLQDERGDDNYADLEDFIVPMDAMEQ
ncbi:FANCI solenoid 2 [Gracilaria domingensis]|nr:FANCI solenoid 2 [Gracilaria domingensis]